MTVRPVLRARDLRKQYGRDAGLVRPLTASTSPSPRARPWPSWDRAAAASPTLLHLLGGLDRPSDGELWFGAPDRPAERAGPGPLCDGERWASSSRISTC